MRRIRLTAFGPPQVLELEEVPDPVPRQGHVLIAVAFAGVTFVDTQVRSGRPPWPGPLPPIPYLPGNGVEGVVTAVGPAVDDALIGVRVVTATGGSGGYADRVTVDADSLIRIPAELPAGVAVALLADGRTAISLLRAGALVSGETVLITAAAGGVGGLLVQLARTAGATTVIALAGGSRKCAYAESFGAQASVDYLQPNWRGELIKVVERHGLDVAFDGVGGSVGRAVFDAAPARSRLCVFGMSSGAYTEASVRDIVARGLSVVGGVQLGSAAESKALSTEALTAAALGHLRPTIGRVFPLERAAEAHAAVESREVLGKTLLEC